MGTQNYYRKKNIKCQKTYSLEGSKQGWCTIGADIINWVCDDFTKSIYHILLSKMMTISWDEYFIQVANLISKRSSCLVKQFGAVITKNNRIISTGYNGTPSQFLNCNQGGCKRCEDRIKGKIKTGEQLEKCLCMHAEASAILQNSKECQGSTLYVTGEPCIQCAKLILSVGIERVVCFQGQYIDNGVFLLNKKNKDGKNVIVERYK
jgi:dCMP deaminase